MEARRGVRVGVQARVGASVVGGEARRAEELCHDKDEQWEDAAESPADERGARQQRRGTVQAQHAVAPSHDEVQQHEVPGARRAAPDRYVGET